MQRCSVRRSEAKNGKGTSMAPLDVVIPTLNAQRYLAETLASLKPAKAGGLVNRIVVVDGGSTDDSRDIALAMGADLLECPRGRGRQLAHGAGAGSAPWLLFLHADSRPDPTWIDEARTFCRRGAEEAECAAVFRLRFDDTALAARILERIVVARTRLFALPYGDQGLLIPRSLYDAVGGFADMPLMEDVDLARRLGRRRIRLLRHHVTTSAERYRSAGYLRRSLRNLGTLTLYVLGVPPETLAKLYD